MSAAALILLAFLFVGHFLGDFTPLATDRMQEAKRDGKPLGPIALHALVHAVLVGVGVAAIARPAPLLGLAAVAVEFWTHLGIDWYRGRLTARHEALRDAGGRLYWSVLGFDQLAHGLVLVAIAWMVLL